jgi:zinc/manganese transport system substrate-binding protein
LTGLLKAKVDPHEYEPQPQDVKTVAGAQLVIVNGVRLEQFLDKLITNSGTKAALLDSSRGLTLRMRKDEDGKEEPEPHIWHSPANAVIMLNNIRDGLSRADPANAALYKANAAYEKKLNDTDQYVKAQIATLAPANRKIVSNHDALGYYFERYGLTFVRSVIPSMDSNFQPSAQELAALVNAIKARKVKAIFSESSLNPKLAMQIAAEAGVKVVDGALYGDTLGHPGSGAETLDGMLKANTDLIVKNLQ